MSRARVRGTTTHSATGAAHAAARTRGAGSRRRRRTMGAATPAASTAQAAARTAVRRTAREYKALRGGRERCARDRAHEAEHDARAGIDLRMPLHAEGEPLVGQLDRLHQVVEDAPAARHDPVPQPVDALVVV